MTSAIVEKTKKDSRSILQLLEYLPWGWRGKNAGLQGLFEAIIGEIDKVGDEETGKDVKELCTRLLDASKEQEPTRSREATYKSPVVHAA